MAAEVYDPTPWPWPALIPGTNTPQLSQPQIGRLTSVLIHLTNGHDYPPFSFLPDALNAFSSREKRISVGIWAYFHAIPILPTVDEIRDLALPPPDLKLPRRVAVDLAKPWVPLRRAEVRNEIFNDRAPRYRLVFFLHRFPHKDPDDAGYNSRQEVFGFTVWDREHDTVRFFDFWDEGSQTRQESVLAYWRRVRIHTGKAAGVVAPPVTLGTRVRRGLNRHNTEYQSLANMVGRSRTRRLPPRLSIYACMGAAMDMMNRIDDRAPLVPDDTSDVMSGLRTDLIPLLFDQLLDILRAQAWDPAQAWAINFEAPLPRVLHMLPHAGQPFLDRFWVRTALPIPNNLVNRLLRNRLRVLLVSRVVAGTMPAWYPLEIVPP